jgi:hypothetical protein
MLRKVLTSAQIRDRMSLGLGAFPKSLVNIKSFWERLLNFGSEALYTPVPYFLSSMNQTNALEIPPALFLAQHHIVGSLGRIAI